MRWIKNAYISVARDFRIDAIKLRAGFSSMNEVEGRRSRDLLSAPCIIVLNLGFVKIYVESCLSLRMNFC